MSAAGSDDFDAIPDQFEGADVDWDSIPGLEASTSTARPTSANSSFDYWPDDSLDENFLAAVDDLERRAVEGVNQSRENAWDASTLNRADSITPLACPTSSSPTSSSRSPPQSPRFAPSGRAQSMQIPPDFNTKWPPDRSAATRLSARPPLKPSWPSSPSQVPSPKTKERGKSKSESNVMQLLEGFEREMTCPICCDIYVAAHLGNPCGHTFCGECGWLWISKNKHSPTCAFCRTRLNVATPMIPNFAMDNTVEKHINALTASGEHQWQKNGQKLKDWQMRKEKWKKFAQERNAMPQAPRRGHRIRRSLWDLEEWASGIFTVNDDVNYIGAFEDVRMTISSAGTRASP